MMLCPNCLNEVQEFTENTEDDNIIHTCPDCDETVPLRYVREYAEYPPVIFSLVGLSGHGKTVYLCSLLHEFENIGLAKWREFRYTPLDEDGMRNIREKQSELAAGRLPDSTLKIFPKPVILRLKGVPEFGDCHLLVYDTSGEAFTEQVQLREYAGYVSRSETIVWLVSLRDLESPRELVGFLVSYIDGILRLGGEPKQQKLLVALTKGDELLADPDFEEDMPAGMKQFLAAAEGDNDKTELESLSKEIEAWLEQKPGYVVFVRQARDEFEKVEYCVLSALGSAPQGQQQQVSIAPRGAWVPLRWMLWWRQAQQEAEAQRRQAEAEQRRQAEAQRLQQEEAERRRQAEEWQRMQAATEAEQRQLAEAWQHKQRVRNRQVWIALVAFLIMLLAMGLIVAKRRGIIELGYFQWNTHRNDTYGFAVDYPDGWKMEEIPFEKRFRTKFTPSPYVFFLIDAGREVHKQSPIDSWKQTDLAFQQKYDSERYQSLAMENTILGGVPAAKWVFRLRWEDDPRQQRVDIGAKHNGIGYALLYAAPVEKFSSYQKVFDHVVESFRFLK